jgi:hypothetical protein
LAYSWPLAAVALQVFLYGKNLRQLLLAADMTTETASNVNLFF